ncbi:hypothetical protein PMG11_11302 [Penicillium brasilianum]|uniref:Aminoglycoside phosphotransferase domain-containing protein n=1 Tax=Penicillium brasilianum TaxID=104259 RepID=A0A0F7U4W8_PENBI|nr:hypothetical protein PMG11_11302 [Penicillium brasilianum]
MATDDPDIEQLFRYTSGRWLWSEEQQLQDRYKAFNVTQLQILAAQAIGSDGCVSITKLAEGGFNKVFRLQMSDGKSLLARIPNPNAGPAFYTTASEVATMEFVRDILQIPVPRILGWSANSENPVGSEYNFMEEAAGKQLATQWDDLTPDSKLAIMREIVAIETKLLSVSFSHYGSLYFSSDKVDGARVSKRFTIGPTVERDFWKKERGTMDISRGPWASAKEYASSVGWREVDWITKYAVPKPSDDILSCTSQNEPRAHLNLLEKYLSIATSLMDIDPLLSRPTLWHSDLHSSNIFVDNNRITAVIDWQGSWAGPLLLQAQPSPLVDYQGSILLKRPANFDDLDSEQQVQIKRQIFKSTLFQLYLMETERRNPLLAKVFHLNHGKTRRLAVELAGNTGDDEIVPFREALINVEKYELGIWASPMMIKAQLQLR